MNVTLKALVEALVRASRNAKNLLGPGFLTGSPSLLPHFTGHQVHVAKPKVKGFKVLMQVGMKD